MTPKISAMVMAQPIRVARSSARFICGGFGQLGLAGCR